MDELLVTKAGASLVHAATMNNRVTDAAISFPKEIGGMRRHWRGFTVHTGGKAQRAKENNNDLRTGCPVPDNGFYRVLHAQHRLPKEITLLFGQPFPRCSKCAEPVYFELIRPAPMLGMNGSSFSVALYELPELAEQDEQPLAG